MMKPCTPFHLTQTPLDFGPSLIEASAGTGKTYAITCLVVRLILEQKLAIREILVVTYTDAATQELRDRIRQMLAMAGQAFIQGASDVPFLQELLALPGHERAECAARLQNALGGFDEAPIYTIHSFCQRTLRDRAFESGLLFDTELATDPSDLLREVADDFWRTHFYATAPVLVQFALKNGLGPDAFMQLLRTCLNYPKLEFLSQAKGQSLDSLSAQLEARFQEARTVWLTQQNEIKPCFGAAIKWGNKPYNCDEAMAGHFEDLDICFGQSQAAFEAFACLEVFCAAALEEKRNKRPKNPPPIPVHPFFTICEALCAIEQVWLAGLFLAFVEFARAQMPKRKAERKVQFYDDLLTRLDEALQGPSGEALAEHLRSRYRAALIDEFQDTDPIQYEIFRRAFGGGRTFLLMIGDPKQAIYGFRGADIFTYLQAAAEAKHRYTLGENWRSESGLVQAVNQVFRASPRSFVFERIEFQEVIAKGQADATPLRLEGKAAPPFQCWFWERGSEITKKDAHATLPGVVASEIVRLLNGGHTLGERKLLPEDIAVLVLENKQAALIQDALNACRVPNVLYTTASLFESPEAAELHRVLTGMANPNHEPLVRSALSTELMGMDGSTLQGISEPLWQGWIERFHAYLAIWEDRGFFRMFRHWLRQERIRPRLLAFANGERRLTNLLHLGEVLHQVETDRRLGVSTLVKWLTDQMANEENAPEAHQLRLERDENAVRIVTVHKSKGLEYPVVFCPFSWKSSEIKRGSDEQVFFHDPDQEQRLFRDLGPAIEEPHRELARQEKLAENVRLLYVALTRAKHRCYFVWGRFKGAGTSAPSWLFHRPALLDGPVIDQLDAHFKNLTDDVMRQQLETIAAQSGRAIEISPLPNLPNLLLDQYQPETKNVADLQARAFSGLIQQDWVISSFTGLIAGRREEEPDRDAVDAELPPVTSVTPATGFFGFPRGAKVGICLHEILERLDFGADEASMTALVRHHLQMHQLDEPGATETVCAMLQNLLRFPLEPSCPDLQLSCIVAANRLNELEFYFPMKNLVAERLYALVDTPRPTSASSFPIHGYLRGFIDLVFQFAGRYYLVDWKSNWLGNSFEAYAQPALRAEMQGKHYLLQYHLYTVALHKYLKLRLPGYEYDQHFGGVFYLFLRGLDPAHPDGGAFRARPSAAVVDQLSSLLASV